MHLNIIYGDIMYVFIHSEDIRKVQPSTHYLVIPLLLKTLLKHRYQNNTHPPSLENGHTVIYKINSSFEIIIKGIIFVQNIQQYKCYYFLGNMD